MPKIKVVRQDIGRVLLNLFNNALQALSSGQEKNGQVKVKTGFSENRIMITISDNGPGVPDQIKNKIFQPFFTTKPTGEGTGLGLSLAYDIVRAHGGEIDIETTWGEGTSFIIKLPVRNKEIMGS